ncbi:MAG: IPExxxVDY family protein [Bacteroidales bacterium]|nr:IPExxxVDY family protein [Bacteroidales bacterium]MBN2756600.1 IPExxxVDY family protein [Bacteroidales bacterium]
MKKKIIKLSINRQFQLIGINSNLSSYKLSWLINSNISFKFTQSDDIIFENRKNNKKLYFSCYVFEDDDEVIYNLISNKTEDGVLLKSLKNIDFFLKIEPYISEYQINKLLNDLKKIENIITVLEINTDNLKLKDLEVF